MVSDGKGENSIDNIWFGTAIDTTNTRCLKKEILTFKKEKK